jgi:hypothetical protein
LKFIIVFPSLVLIICSFNIVSLATATLSLSLSLSRLLYSGEKSALVTYSA